MEGVRTTEERQRANPIVCVAAGEYVERARKMVPRTAATDSFVTFRAILAGRVVACNARAPVRSLLFCNNNNNM